MFELGEKVVCIKIADDSTNGPTLNEIVTIQEFYQESGDERLFLVLEEYFYDGDGEEQCFYSPNFRKLDRQFTADLIESLCKGQEKENLITI